MLTSGLRLTPNTHAIQNQDTADSAQNQDGATIMNTKDDSPAPNDEIDIDLDDADVEKAAVKIQAGFKGMKARQEVRVMKVRLLCCQINSVPYIN